MHIAIFLEAFYPYVNGVITHVQMLRDGFEKRGHRVLIVTADPKWKHHTVEDGVLYCPAAELKKIYGYGLASPLSSNRMRMIEEFNPDIIHVHQEFGVCFSGVRAAKKLNVPLVYTLHTMYNDYLHYVVSRSIQPIAKRVFYRYVRYFADSADVLLSPSGKAIGFFEECKVKDKQVQVVPNAIDLMTYDRNQFTEEQLRNKRRELNLPEDAIVGLFVGRLGQEKSVDYLVRFWHESLREHSRQYLVVVGGGPEYENLVQMAKDLGVTEQVRFLGRIEHADVPIYYAMADYFVTASTTEMMSISMLEGMAAGLPAVLRRDPLNDGQIDDGVNGYIFDSEEDLFRIVTGLEQENMKEVHARVREASIKLGIDCFTERMQGIYQNAIDNYVPKKRFTHRRR